ncbi:hypothetical protein [Kitasatospora sp. NPDC058190]|uniref:hypothetical protein n=1 Tax=Kitasatospora sp. NPDC058190 TaxID=3346371 RepID=UPI0036DABEDC
MHLPRDPLGSFVDALDAAVAVREGEFGVDGGEVECEAVCEGVQVGEVGGANRGDPVGGLGVVARCWGRQLRELAREEGEFDHLVAGFGEFPP